VQQAQAQQIIEVNVRNAIYSLNIVKGRLGSARDAQTFAQEQYASELRKFQAGLSSVFLVSQRQTSLLNAKLRYTQVLSDLNKAIAGYYRSIGGLLEQQGVRLDEKDVF
jgi:outer membrane protein